MHKRQVISVGQVNRYVKKMLDSDVLLAGLFVRGEISNFKAHTSGHLYFSLKDRDAVIGAVMFSSQAENIDFAPKNGMEVVVFGRISLYEKTGQYQMYAEFMEVAGVGQLRNAISELKKKLEEEGLFDGAKKKPIPEFARTIAIITSPTSAAVQDVLRVARNRNRAVKLVVIPSAVQGSGAAEELAEAVGAVNRWGMAEVIILCRGGGSEEDLLPFNQEVLARAVHCSKIPIISAVGHETDFTISDFVADLRAPTPTAAAHIACFDQMESLGALGFLYEKMENAVLRKQQGIFDELADRYGLLNRGIDSRLKDWWQTLLYSEALLEKVSPYAAFHRGFSYVTDDLGAQVSSKKNVKKGQSLNIAMSDGTVGVVVTEV